MQVFGWVKSGFKVVSNVCVVLLVAVLLIQLGGITPPAAHARAGWSDGSAFPGAIMFYGGDHVATSSLYESEPGWFLCNGAIASISVYPGLYKRLGKKYTKPADPADSFRIPDPQGVYFKLFGTNGTLGANYANASGTPQPDKMQGHIHALNGDATNLGTRNRYALGDPSSGAGGYPSGIETAYNTLSDGTNGAPRTGTITEPANVGVCALIKY